jgi:catechol 2,3-dioxygenase-like lactoylglutathione lyase family enzyme
VTDAPLITGIDHVVIGVHDLDEGVADYRRLLGYGPTHAFERDGARTALFPTADVAVELMAPHGDGEGAQRLRTALERDGQGWMSLVLAVSDIERMHRRADRVGLTPAPIVDGEAEGMSWRRFRADTERTLGLRLFFIQRDKPIANQQPGDVVGLDHAVIRARDMEHAAALFGARLGFSMRLERDPGAMHLMFFRCGDVILEIAADKKGGERLWGLSWRVKDANAAHARLAEAGVHVSEARPGQKPGTRVFTVRDGTAGVPTLMIETDA